MALRKTLTFRMHGLGQHRNAVAAQEFARKLSALVRGLGKADTIGHGRRCLTFLLTDLKMGSAEAQITEQQSSTKHIPHSSGIDTFYRAARAVSEGSGVSLNGSTELLAYLRSMSVNADKGFSHIDMIVDGDEESAIRIDGFFAEQVVATRDAIKHAQERAKRPLFKGRSRTSLDGTLKAADHRGAKKLAVLTLTAGGAEIESVYSENKAAEIGSHFDTRCRVDAWAHYDDTSPLPRRLELIGATEIRSNASLSKYRGAFRIPDDDDEHEWIE